MTSKPKNQNNFAQALRLIRKAKGVSQEAFALTSSRTYVSTLERGLKSPTLSKIDDLAEVLGVHPLTLLMAAYSEEDLAAVEKARKELISIKRIQSD
jgi:transcriptional regulator with XRE-family HTH domain